MGERRTCNADVAGSSPVCVHSEFEVVEFSSKYRYHPESADTLKLCKQLEEKLPGAQFSHSYFVDSVAGKALLQISAWDETHEHYYSQTLRDSQDPIEVAERFYNRLKPRHQQSVIWLPNSAL